MANRNHLFSLLLGATLSVHSLSALSWFDMDPLALREMINAKIMGVEAEAPAVWNVSDQLVERDGRQTPLRIYRPHGDGNYPVILMIHGGAWIAGNLDTHDHLARYLSSQSQSLVVSVGYQNSPEGKFPMPMQQCYDALLWVQAQAADLDADLSRLAVVGDSAGGNMTASLCLMARDLSGPAIQLQVLINPAPDLTGGGTLERQNDIVDLLRYQALQYLSDPQDAYHPYASPLFAKDLSCLPPALIILAEKDELRDDGQRYADRLRSAGVPTEVFCQSNIGHLAGNGARASLCARESLDAAVKALKTVFKQSDGSME